MPTDFAGQPLRTPGAQHDTAWLLWRLAAAASTSCAFGLLCALVFAEAVSLGRTAKCILRSADAYPGPFGGVPSRLAVIVLVGGHVPL